MNFCQRKNHSRCNILFSSIHFFHLECEIREINTIEISEISSILPDIRLADRRTQNCTMLIKSCDLAVGYDLGGVSTCSKRDPEHGKRPAGGKEPHCLYPGDLYPFTRKPLFVVVDSDNSFVFQQIPRYFGQPLMVLMSPQDVPPYLRDLRHGGSLFTLFLHAPLAAFCLICNVGSLPVQHWERCQRYIERFLNEASQLVTRSRCGKDTDCPRRRSDKNRQEANSIVEEFYEISNRLSINLLLIG